MKIRAAAKAALLASFLSITAAALPAIAADPITLHLHGNTHDGALPSACSGQGNLDGARCSGPLLLPSATLDPTAPAARYVDVGGNIVGPEGVLVPSAAQNPYKPNWTWTLAAPVTVTQYLGVNLWVACNVECALIGQPWDVYVFVDGGAVPAAHGTFEGQPPLGTSTGRVSAIVDLGAGITANSRIAIEIAPAFYDSGAGATFFYDSVAACPGAPAGPCDSTVTFNAVADSGGGPTQGINVDYKGAVYGGADPTVPGVPRYQNFGAPLGMGADGTGGEYSIGFNPKTGAIMNMSVSFTAFDPDVGIDAASAGVFKVVVPELRTPMLEASCDAAWVDTSSPFRSTPQVVADPILWTDQDTGRTFAADDTTGPNPAAEYAFTDDDGATWTPVGAGLVGADHETVVSGPYPAGSPYEQLAIAAGYKYKDKAGVEHGKAVYWCTQESQLTIGNGVNDTCVRSDDGGVTWTPPQVVSKQGDPCLYLHGHLHIAPDGTAYLPIKTCNTTGQGGAYSTNAGDTWTQFVVPNVTKPTHGSDPSIGIDADGTLYFCYVNGDGHPHVQVGHKAANGTLSWDLDTDLGAAHGLRVATFPESVGGDSGRAACGFVGTNGVNPNNPADVQGVAKYEALDFGGVWYLYIATTYDGGRSWTTVNATPDDPVQGIGGIWQNGGSNVNRNLLDFNEITLDDKGRVLFGYNDGCVGRCVQDKVGAIDSFHQIAVMKVARQTGGRSLYAKYDTLPATNFADTPTSKPGRACIGGTRDDDMAHVTWRAPDPHGSPITGYTITATRADTGATTTYRATGLSADLPADRAATYTYAVTATNANGVSEPSVPVSLVSTGPAPPEQSACTGNGVTLLTSPPGVTGNAGLPTKQDDILAVYAEEPAGQQDKLVLRLKVDNLSPVPPPGHRWMIQFNIPGDSRLLWVAMSTSEGPTPVFNYGFKTVTNAPALPAVGSVTGVGMYTTLGTIPGSYTTDGFVTFELNTGTSAANPTPFKLGDGAKLTNIAGQTRQSTPGQASNAGLTTDAIGGGSYTVVKNHCVAAIVRPLAPASLTAAAGAGSVTLSWPASAGATGYDVFQGTSPGGEDTTAVATVADTGATITGLTNGQVYYFAVRAFNSAGSSGAATEASATPTVPDADGDGVTDSADNCPAAANADQSDVDGDGIGDACDPVDDRAQNPDPFTFVVRSNVVTNVFVTSEAKAMSGFGGALPVSVSTNNNSQYSVNGGAWTNVAGVVHAGDSLAVRHLSASTASTEVDTTVTVGSYGTTFTSVTSAADRTPDAFTFGTKTGVVGGSVVESDAVTLTGYNAPISLVAGPGLSYSIEGGAWTSAGGTLSPGQSIRVRHTATTTSMGYTKTYLKAGGVTGYFTTRTQ